jgi:type 1 glutamine amidotransferase
MLSAGGAQEKPKAPRVLIVTGSDVPAHDWRATTPATRRILEEGGIEVVVSEEPAVLETKALRGYDAVLLNYRNQPTEKLSDAARENLAAYVSGGGGLVALHFAVSAWGDWPEFRKLVGRVWVGKRDGGASGHGPRGTFRVRITGGEHPVAKGLGDFDADDECYSALSGDTPIEVIAAAKSDFTGKDEPMAWTLTYGKGRAFVSVLGHDVKSREIAGFQELLRRGTRWAAGRETPR